MLLLQKEQRSSGESDVCVVYLRAIVYEPRDIDQRIAFLMQQQQQQPNQITLVLAHSPAMQELRKRDHTYVQNYSQFCQSTAHEHHDTWQLQLEEYLKAVEIERQQMEQRRIAAERERLQQQQRQALVWFWWSFVEGEAEEAGRKTEVTAIKVLERNSCKRVVLS